MLTGDKRYGEGKLVAKITKSSKSSGLVSLLQLPKNTEGRFVTLRLPGIEKKLEFRELEVYNGPLIGVMQMRSCVPILLSIIYQSIYNLSIHHINIGNTFLRSLYKP